MIDKKIVFETINRLQGIKYLFEKQIESLIGYVDNYITFEYKKEDLEESVREGIKIYFELMNEQDKRNFGWDDWGSQTGC